MCHHEGVRTCPVPTPPACPSIDIAELGDSVAVTRGRGSGEVAMGRKRSRPIEVSFQRTSVPVPPPRSDPVEGSTGSDAVADTVEVGMERGLVDSDRGMTILLVLVAFEPEAIAWCSRMTGWIRVGGWIGRVYRCRSAKMSDGSW